jgi:hypothetical protein
VAFVQTFSLQRTGKYHMFEMWSGVSSTIHFRVCRDVGGFQNLQRLQAALPTKETLKKHEEE